MDSCVVSWFPFKEYLDSKSDTIFYHLWYILYLECSLQVLLSILPHYQNKNSYM